MPVSYRPARIEDLARADALVVSSINDLTEHHGFGRIAASRPTHFQAFSLKDDPSGLWVAEEADEILGFAWSWVCDDLWFLAQLFVAPGHQGRGIGRELIGRTFEHAEKSGAAHRTLITFAFNTVSQGLYLRNGLLPRFPIYSFSIARERLGDRVAGPQLRPAPCEETAAHLDALARIDAAALGVSREKHHRYLIGDGAAKGYALYAEGDIAGYCYVGADGHIGPLAVARHEHIVPAFEAALSLAAEGGSPQVSAFLPGPCAAALELAAAIGMRITLPMLFMSSTEFGDWRRYLPRNPGFM
jgi:ribosomal protein S18 acetylase RimI-like enzyme